MAVVHLSQDDAADALLSKDPLALLIGMVLDQQVPLEWAFSAPLLLKQRLGGRLDVSGIAGMDPEALAAVFSQRPALHRFPASNAKRIQELSRHIVDEYEGKPDHIWRTASSGQELFRRIRALPGFGDQKPGSSSACSASNWACGPPAGRKQPAITGSWAPSCRWRTSPTRRRSPASGRTSKREKRPARARPASPGQKPLPVPSVR